MEPGLDRLLSQDEIDNVFRQLQQKNSEDDNAKKAVPYDFRRPDRIAKDQLRAIHLLHENFARNLSSSLSAYLRAYVMVNLISVEQLSFAEFCRFLPTPSYLVALRMKPFDGNAALELNPSLIFPVLEMLLGGSGKGSTNIARKVTEIEQILLDGLYRIILENLKQAWHAVAVIDFVIEARETEPQLLQVLAPNEAVVAVTIEIRVGESVGMMNLGVPSITIKMLRQRFDQQWSIRKTEVTAQQQARNLDVLKSSRLEAEVRLRGNALLLRDLLDLQPGDVLSFDHSVNRPVELAINGTPKFKGRVGMAGRKRAFVPEGPLFLAE
jgi:flagellar motor switch protein FliM